mgnify:CR=1 FL=1
MLEEHKIGELYLVNQTDASKTIKTGDMVFCTNLNKKYPYNEYLLIENNFKFKSDPVNLTKVEFTDKLKGKKVCITGTLLYPRDYYKKIIEINGGAVSDTIVKSLSFLIASNEFLRDEARGHPSTKIQKARDYKIDVVSFNDFLKLLK